MPGKMLCLKEDEREYLIRLVESSSITSFSISENEDEDEEPIDKRILDKLRMPGDGDDKPEFDYA